MLWGKRVNRVTKTIMDLRQAYKILEISESSSMSEVKQAYRDLAQIWHPDRQPHNERLQKKALKKMKELNEAYDCICTYLETEKTTNFTDNRSNQRGYTERMVVCPQCNTKNRVPPSHNDTEAKCGKCGNYLFREQYKEQPEADWEHVTPCGDKTCTGVIDSTGRCTKCGKTYEECIRAGKYKREKRKQILVGIILVILIYFILIIYYQFLTSNETGSNNPPTKDSVRTSPAEPLGHDSVRDVGSVHTIRGKSNAKTALKCAEKNSECPYFSDIYAGDAEFRKSFIDSLSSATIPIPNWILNGTESPCLPVNVAGKTYLKGSICQPHNCLYHQVIFLYLESQKRTIGKYVRENDAPIWFGNPTRLEREKVDETNY
jgi:hypothetical protein